jgi:NCS1 family nucleobase:cation symporter-1
MTAQVEIPSDAFLKVETHGIEAIPDAERHGHPRELGFLWAGAFVNYASLLTASLLTTYYGLGVWDGLLAVLIGTVAGAVILGLLSNTGPKSGQPQIVYTRRIFGNRGAYPGAVLTLFLGVGWFAVDTVIAALAGVQLLQVAGVPPDLAGRFLFPWVLVIAAVSVAVAVYGHRTIKVFETFGAVAFAVFSLLLFGLLAGQMHWTAGATATGADYPGAFVLGVMSCFALVASWYPFASDYSRYLPARSSVRAVTWWPIVGVTLPMLLLGLFGLLLPTIDPKLASDSGVLAVITKHAPAAVAVPFFAFVILGEIWANYLDVYTAGLVTHPRCRHRDRRRRHLGFPSLLSGLSDPHLPVGAGVGGGRLAELLRLRSGEGPTSSAGLGDRHCRQPGLRQLPELILDCLSRRPLSESALDRCAARGGHLRRCERPGCGRVISGAP